MIDYLRYALREARCRPRRTAGVVLGYLAATTALVLVLTSIRSTRNAAVQTLWDIGAHTMAFVPTCCGVPAAEPPQVRFAVNNMPAELLADDVVETLRRSPVIADASPYLLVSIRHEDTREEWIVGGFDPSRPKAFSATMAAASQVVEGRFIHPESPGGVMVEKEFAAAHRLTVGSELRLGDGSHAVVAIVAPPLRPGKANIYMDIGALRQLASSLTNTDTEHALNAVLVESKGAQFHQEALADIRAALGPMAQITTYGCSNPGSLAMHIHERSTDVVVLLAVAGLFALLLRAQAACVVERRREISVLRAVGWSRRDVASQFLAAAVLQAAVGSVLGCAIGAAASRTAVVQGILGMPAVAPLSSAVATTACVLGVALLAGLTAGLLPAWLAARLRPAEVLRQP